MRRREGGREEGRKEGRDAFKTSTHTPRRGGKKSVLAPHVLVLNPLSPDFYQNSNE